MASHAETVLAIYAAVADGDVDTVLGYLAGDVGLDADWHSNSAQDAGVPWMQARRGIDQLRDFFQVGETMHVLRLEPGEPMVGGRKVAVEVEFEKSAPDVRDTECHVFTFNAENKVIAIRHYLDTAKHMAAARIGTNGSTENCPTCSQTLPTTAHTPPSAT